MIKGQAELNDAEYIDTYKDSIGHDVCKLPPNRWFEGVVPTEPAYPLHPNGKGEATWRARDGAASLGGPGRRGPPEAAARNRGPPRAQCSPPAARSGAGQVGRVRLGYTRRALARRVKVAPARRSRLAQIWCTKRGTGRVAAVFSKRSSRARVEMIITTAPSRRRSGSGYPPRRSLGPGLFRSSPRSNRLLYVRRGRVLFVAVCKRACSGSPERLGRDFRLALG